MMNLKVFGLILSIVCMVHGNTTTATPKVRAFKNPSSYKNLEDSVEKVIALSSSFTPTTKWLVSPKDPATNCATILNSSTRKYLDSNSLGDVFTLADPGGLYQKWKTTGSTLINCADGRALTLDAAGNVFTSVPNGGNGQIWRVL